MSYCHLLSGGYGNISLNFGLDHPYGVAPERVPNRMLSHVVARSASSPGCLDPATPLHHLVITTGGNGNGIVTSVDGGIDCGSDCIELYEDRSAVSLIAAAELGNEFVGWSGDADCSDGTLSMTADRSCQATFQVCTETTPEDVSGQSIADTQVFEACQTLIAGDFEVLPPTGDVTFRAGSLIALEDGFTVYAGARFRAEVGLP
jgi:hypothetical protein